MGKIQISDAERERRSENMRELHAKGKAGAAFGHLGGRPRKKRVSEVINEKMEKEAENIWSNLRQLAFDSESEKIRMDTTFKLLEIEEKERKVVIDEEVGYERLKHGDLAEFVIGNLFELLRTGEINLGEIIDAEDVTELEVVGIGEGDYGDEEKAEEAGATD